MSPKTKLVLCEFALDFSHLTVVTREYARRYAIFGKSQRDLSSTNPAGDWWGARQGGKRVKSYLKHTICGHRVEFRLRSKFLRHHEIHDVFDFPKFLEVLPRKHILFARLSEERLVRRLHWNGITAVEQSRILRVVRKSKADLGSVLSYLRRVVGLKNVRRLLLPLSTNRIVLDAIRSFAAEWPKVPNRLGNHNG